MLYDNYQKKQSRLPSNKIIISVLLLITIIIICLPLILPREPINSLNAAEYGKIYSQLNEGTWLIMYYLPNQDDWANTVWKEVLHELEYSQIDIEVISVKTRPEVGDFGRKYDILSWPTIEIFNDGMVHKHNLKDKYDVRAILHFIFGGWKEKPAEKKSDWRMRNII